MLGGRYTGRGKKEKEKEKGKKGKKKKNAWGKKRSMGKRGMEEKGHACTTDVPPPRLNPSRDEEKREKK